MGVEIQMSSQRRADNRQARRFRYRVEVTARPLDTGLSLEGGTLDLSAQGCLLRLPDPGELKVGTLIDMNIRSKMVSFRALGSVRYRARRRRLVGVFFVHLNQRGEAELLDLLTGLEEGERTERRRVREMSPYYPVPVFTH